MTLALLFEECASESLIFSLCTEDGYVLDMKCEDSKTKRIWKNLIQKEMDQLAHISDLIAAKRDKTVSKKKMRAPSTTTTSSIVREIQKVPESPKVAAASVLTAVEGNEIAAAASLKESQGIEGGLVIDEKEMDAAIKANDMLFRASECRYLSTNLRDEKDDHGGGFFHPVDEADIAETIDLKLEYRNSEVQKLCEVAIQNLQPEALMRWLAQLIRRTLRVSFILMILTQIAMRIRLENLSPWTHSRKARRGPLSYLCG